MKLSTSFWSYPSLPPLIPLFDSVLMGTSDVWDLVRDHGLEKGQVLMYNNRDSITSFMLHVITPFVPSKAVK